MSDVVAVHGPLCVSSARILSRLCNRLHNRLSLTAPGIVKREDTVLCQCQVYGLCNVTNLAEEVNGQLRVECK